MSKEEYPHQNNTDSPSLDDQLEMKPVGLHRDDVIHQTADDQKMLEIKEEVPLEWRSSLEQQDPEGLNIKEEEEEGLTSVKGEETETFPLTVIVKNEDDDEEGNCQYFQFYQNKDSREAEPPTISSVQPIKTEVDGEDYGGPEPDRNPGPKIYFQLNTDENSSDSSETEVSVNEEDDCHKPPSDVGTEMERDKYLEFRELESDLNDEEGCDTAKAIFSCFECDKKYFYKQSLHRHMKCHSPSLVKTKHCGGQEDEDPCTKVKTKKTFICDICGQKFNQRTNLSTHKRVHTGERPFSCDECGKRFSQRGNLRNHRRVHTGEKPFTCDFCGERFRNQGILQAHTRVHTGEKPFVCDVCGRKFSRKTHFNTHMRVHTGERPFGCGVCGKEFSHKTHFVEHVRVHSGEKPFLCGTCGKRFRLQGNLKRHMRVHTGEKPFGCNKCGKTFSCNSHLKRHMKIHTGERSFGCEVCGEKFTDPGVLKSHVRIHTGEKPFRCAVCGKTFRQKSTLRRHSVVHTGEKPFSCALCDLRFSQQGNLKSHMRIHT